MVTEENEEQDQLQNTDSLNYQKGKGSKPFKLLFDSKDKSSKDSIKNPSSDSFLQNKTSYSGIENY